MIQHRTETIISLYSGYPFREAALLPPLIISSQSSYFNQVSKLASIINPPMDNGIPTHSFKAIMRVTLGLPRFLALLVYVLLRTLASTPNLARTSQLLIRGQQRQRCGRVQEQLVYQLLRSPRCSRRLTQEASDTTARLA